MPICYVTVGLFARSIKATEQNRLYFINWYNVHRLKYKIYKYYITRDLRKREEREKKRRINTIYV